MYSLLVVVSPPVIIRNALYASQALLALQTMQALVATAGKHLRPHLAAILKTLVPRLGDHKVKEKTLMR